MSIVRETDAGWQSGMAKSITFIVTKDCQLACKYCYLVGKNVKERMSWETAKAFIDYVLSREDEFREESDELQFLAFEMYVLQERDAQEVAEILKISINQVYLAKSRGVARLRFLIERLKRDET